MGGEGGGMNIVSEHDMSTLCYQEVAHDLLCWSLGIEPLVHANFMHFLTTLHPYYQRGIYFTSKVLSAFFIFLKVQANINQDDLCFESLKIAD